MHNPADIADTALQDRLLRAPEAAARLGVGIRTVFRLRDHGRLPEVRIGGAIRFRLSDIHRLVRDGVTTGNPEQRVSA